MRNFILGTAMAMLGANSHGAEWVHQRGAVMVLLDSTGAPLCRFVNPYEDEPDFIILGMTGSTSVAFARRVIRGSPLAVGLAALAAAVATHFWCRSQL